MDPSYNNPQYYPPTQQDYANQQGYTQADSYQYPQQPQTQNYAQDTNNNLNELDRGCFQVYKIALLIVFGWRIYNLVGLIGFLAREGGFNFTFLIAFALEFSLMALIFLQFSAMKDRNLQKAKMAFICFLGYYFVCIIYQICLVLLFLEMGFELLFEQLLSVFIEIILTLIGSFKVYQFLNVNQIKCESDNYQSYYKA